MTPVSPNGSSDRRRPDASTRHPDASTRSPDATVPAYGPIEAALGYVVFYVFVSRATPTAVEVLPTAIEGLSPSTVRFGLAVVLWLALAANVLEQVRRQVVAVRQGYSDDFFQAAVATETWMLGYGLVLVIGGLVAWVTFDRAVETGIDLVRILVTLDVGSLIVADVVLLIVFFVCWGVAIRAADRLVIGGLRFAGGG